MIAMFGLGPLEMLVIAGIFLVSLLAVGAALAMVFIGFKSRPSNPNLTPCPDCKTMVSIHAESCRKCGCPLTPVDGI